MHILHDHASLLTTALPELTMMTCSSMAEGRHMSLQRETYPWSADGRRASCVNNLLSRRSGSILVRHGRVIPRLKPYTGTALDYLDYDTVCHLNTRAARLRLSADAALLHPTADMQLCVAHQLPCSWAAAAMAVATRQASQLPLPLGAACIGHGGEVATMFANPPKDIS
jgi:hypothetical protein